MREHEFAFDATFAAVVRVNAPSEQSAREALDRLLDCASINVFLSDSAANLRITEASIYADDKHAPFLFEIDGRNVEYPLHSATNPPPSLRKRIVSDKVYELRHHSDVRIARRAQIISRLAQTISEREVKIGLRRALVTQAERLRFLASARFSELGGQATVPRGPEDEEDSNGDS